MGMVRRWREYARQYGRAGLVRHIAERAVSPLWEYRAVQMLSIDHAPVSMSARMPIHVRELLPETGRQTPFYTPEWDKRWEKGDRCWSAWLAEQCVHYSWVASQPTYVAEIHQWIQVQPPEAYVYDCFTAGQARGLGVFPAVLTSIGRELTSTGTKRVWIAVERENIASAKAITKAGFEPAALITFLRVGPVSRATIRPFPDSPTPPLSSDKTGA